MTAEHMHLALLRRRGLAVTIARSGLAVDLVGRVGDDLAVADRLRALVGLVAARAGGVPFSPVPVHTGAGVVSVDGV